MTDPTPERPATMFEMDHRDNYAWVYSFSAAMVPFCAFCYGHSRGVTGRVVERVVKSPVGVYGLLALPFVTLSMKNQSTIQFRHGRVSILTFDQPIVVVSPVVEQVNDDYDVACL